MASSKASVHSELLLKSHRSEREKHKLIHPSMHLFIHPTVIHPFTEPHINPSIIHTVHTHNCPPIHIFIHLTILHLHIHPVIHQSTYPFNQIFSHLSNNQSVFIYSSIHIDINSTFHPSIDLTNYSSNYPSIYL